MSRFDKPEGRSNQENGQHPRFGAPTAELCQEGLPASVRRTTSLRNLRFSSGSSSSVNELSPSKTFLLILLAGFCFSLCLQFSHLRFWDHSTNYEDGNTPLMSTLDAYYYLRITEQILSQKDAGRTNLPGRYQDQQSIPLLATITALIHKATKFPVELIAFYLPPILGSLMVIIYTCWGYAVSGPMAAFISSIAGLSSFYWYSRTCLGRFDTDCLNPFFVFGILFLVYRFVISKGSARILYLSLSLVIAYIFNTWWPQVPYFGFSLVIFSYCLSVFLPSSKWEKVVKMVLTVLIVSILLCAFGGFGQFLPHRLEGFINEYAGQLGLIGNRPGLTSTFPHVGASISELQPLPVQEIIEEVGGQIIPFVVALIGLFLLLKKNKAAASFLSIGLIFALLSVFARRFLIFFIPLYALGIGYFVGEFCFRGGLLKKISSAPIRWGLFLSVSIALLLPNLSLSFSRHRGPSLTKQDLELAEIIKKEGTRRDVIWAWWDYGYFLRYQTGLRTFIDGGSQTAERIYIAAFPLSCNDPELARNWMRFFAAHDLGGLRTVRSHFGDQGKAVTFLQNILARPADTEKILKQYGIQDTTGWNEYLFPNVKVWLFLNRDFINKTYWWYYFGTWDLLQGKGVHPMIWLVEGKARYSPEKTGLVKIGDRAVKIDKIVDVNLHGGILKDPPNSVDPGEENGRQLTQSTGHKPGKEAGNVAVSIQKYNIVYVLDPDVFQSLAVQLSFLSPFDIPGFTPAVYNPPMGGVWSVE